jgi:site-specific DNA-methyltransferase (adenine-specific)
VSASAAANSLYFGDNLEILRYEIQSDSVDLIYLDPPFNSKASYNRLFRSPNGHEPHAQLIAFEDTWHWGEQAEREFAELVQQPNTDVSEMMQALRRFLGENDVMAYLTMMANRLLELHRVLKATGSLYLHCDPTASHYLKIVLDGIFGKEMYRNEIIWKRTSAHANVGTKFGVIHDTVFLYGKSANPTWNSQYSPYEPEYVETFFDQVDKNGRRYARRDLTAAMQRASKGQIYSWHGITPPPSRCWAMTKENMDKLEEAGRIHWPRKEGGMPRLKLYPEDLPGVPTQDIWTDIKVMHNLSAERLGYDTQKPLALLERIITASSNEGDIVLDPFCGCGTAVHAAEKLKRRWIGIDITHLAISLIEKRLRDAFPGITFDVHGTPKDLDSAHDLARRDKYQFQWWACSLVNAQPYQGKKKGADTGIDGVIYFRDDKTMAKKIVVSVKAGENVSVLMIRDLGHVVNREKASLGLFVTLTKPTGPMRQEAVKAGFYVNPMGVSVPKIQILTIEGLLAGIEHPHYFDLMQGGLMSRKAEREVDAVQLGFDSAAYLSAVQTTEEIEEPRRKDVHVARAAKPRKASRKTA